jgi:GT2 family glycosyltransferase
MNDGLPRVSVIVPTYQRCAQVRELLDALGNQTLGRGEYEVIVVIDGSTDGTREMVEQLDASFAVRAVAQANRGRAAACNAGLRAARGELVVLLDDDMLPAPRFLEAHLRAHDGHTRRGVMGAAPVPTAHASPAARYIADKFNRHLEKIAQSGYYLQLRDFYTGNFSARRQTLLDVGGFDEEFKVYGNEDLELAVRLRRAGVELRFEPTALAIQRYTKDLAGLARDHIHKGMTAVLLSDKQPETRDQLKLAEYERASPPWRLARGLLLEVSGVCPPTARAVMWGAEKFARAAPGRADAVLRFAFDYFFWLGVFSARRRLVSSPKGSETLLGAAREA